MVTAIVFLVIYAQPSHTGKYLQRNMHPVNVRNARDVAHVRLYMQVRVLYTGARCVGSKEMGGGKKI